MKKISIFTLMFLFSIVSICYTSCNNDEVDDELVNNSSKIIGTWKYTFNNGESFSLLTIKGDQTALYSEWDNGGWDSKYEKLIYNYDENINLISFYDEDGSPWEECIIVTITDKIMVTLDFLDSGKIAWIKQ